LASSLWSLPRLGFGKAKRASGASRRSFVRPGRAYARQGHERVRVDHSGSGRTV
jgi:hypothetical protein